MPKCKANSLRKDVINQKISHTHVQQTSHYVNPSNHSKVTLSQDKKTKKQIHKKKTNTYDTTSNQVCILLYKLATPDEGNSEVVFKKLKIFFPSALT